MTEVQKLLLKILAWVVGVALIFSVGGYLGYHFTDKYLTAQYQAQISKINTDSANKLNEANAAKDAAQQKQAADAAQAKATYDKNISTLNDTVAKLRAEHVVLHDPGHKSHKPAAGSSTVTSTSGSVVSSSGGAALSSGATDFLLGFAQRADTVRAALIECQADDSSIRAAVTDYNTKLEAINAQTSKQAQAAVNKQ